MKKSRNNKDNILIPSFYKEVKKGLVEEDDMIWTPESKNFEDASEYEVGSPVTAFKMVIRPEV